MKIIKSKEIDRGISTSGRVYLCGNLSRPNEIDYFPTNGYEIGISYYQKYTFEKAHFHAISTEFNYVLDGCIKILLLNEKAEYLFEKGDMFIINVNEPYIGKSLPGTRTIFSKNPGGNDKVLVAMDDAVMDWGKSWDAPYIKGD